MFCRNCIPAMFSYVSLVSQGVCVEHMLLALVRCFVVFSILQTHLRAFSSFLWFVFLTTAALLASQTGTFPFSFMDIGSLEVGHAWLASELGEAGFDSKLEEALERLVHVTLVVSAGRLVYACDTCRCGLHIHGCLVVRCFVRCFLFEPQASH